MLQSVDPWQSGHAYEQFMGRWSTEVASRFLEWLGAHLNLRWLDVGCGTGALTRAISAFAQPWMVVGLDPSLSFVKYARQQTDNPFFAVATGGALPIGDEVFDVVVSGLALNFMPQPQRALDEMK